MSHILDLIDGAIWADGEAMRWTPEPLPDHGTEEVAVETGFRLQGAPHVSPPAHVDSHGRVPYEYLDDDERQALHAWCTTHNLDYIRVPIDTLIEPDHATGEWRVEVYRHNKNGNCYLDPDGNIASVILRRAYKADLPWRRP